MICKNSHLSVGQDSMGQDGRRWGERERDMIRSGADWKVRYEAGHGETNGEETGRD